MPWGLPRVVVALAACLLTGCVKTSRVDGELSTASLATANKAVALMRIGSASPSCDHVGVLLGIRNGEGFKPVREMGVANVRSLVEAPVAEVELQPGEYHIIGCSCITDENQVVVSDTAGGQVYLTSYASFTLAPGEVVNVGYFEFTASQSWDWLLGRNVELAFKVADWPLADIERFRVRRPQLFAQMQTRLMVPTRHGAAPDAGACAQLAALKATGKVAVVPASCARGKS